MRILITGGAGFIGSNFVHYWHGVNPEDHIVVVDKLTYAGKKENLAPLLDEILLIQSDITDRDEMERVFGSYRPHMVVNFAAETCVDKSIEQPYTFIHTNVLGTQVLLEKSFKHNVGRFHQVSTDEVYGDLGRDTTATFSTESPVRPNCPYAASKAAADLLVLSYFQTYGLPVTVSRCTNNYGPRQADDKLIPKFFSLAKANKQLPLMGDGSNVRDWLYVDDHCRAIDKILQRGDPGEVYNIGARNERTNLEITHRILAHLERSEALITHVPHRLAHDWRYAINPSKIEHFLGWKPLVSFDEGLRRTFEYYEKLSESNS